MAMFDKLIVTVLVMAPWAWIVYDLGMLEYLVLLPCLLALVASAITRFRAVAEQGKRSPISTLPPELVDNIFSYLDPVESTCLGLISKRFYLTHRQLHGSFFSQRDPCQSIPAVPCALAHMFYPMDGGSVVCNITS